MLRDSGHVHTDKRTSHELFWNIRIVYLVLHENPNRRRETMTHSKLTDSEREHVQSQIDVLIADLVSPGMYLSDEDRRETRAQVKILRLRLLK